MLKRTRQARDFISALWEPNRRVLRLAHWEIAIVEDALRDSATRAADRVFEEDLDECEARAYLAYAEDCEAVLTTIKGGML